MFTVDSDALRAAARELQASAEQLSTAAAYHDEPSRFDFTDTNLYSSLRDTHERLAALLQQRLDEAAQHLAQKARELNAAAEVYTLTDVEAAERIAGQ